MVFLRRRLLQGLQFFAGFESYGLTGRYGHLRAGPGIASDSGLTGLDVEHAETAQFDAISLLEGFLHGFEDRLHGHFSLGFGNAGLVDNFVDDIEFDQTGLPGDRRSTFPALRSTI